MRNNVFGAVALAAAVLAAAPAFAGDHGPDPLEREKLQNSFQHNVSFGYPSKASSYVRSESFTIVRLGELSKGAAASIKAAATPEAREALQASISSNAALSADLRERGVQINNIVGSATAFNGRTVLYLR